MSHSGQVLPGKLIVNEVWGQPCTGDNKTLKSTVYRLRRKIEADARSPRYLQNVPGGGYRFNHISEVRSGS
jgi:DNA-binding response OmpR family regulator